MNERNRAHARKKRLHEDWRTWTVLVVMLAAISMYVLTLDDSVEPVEIAVPSAQP